MRFLLLVTMVVVAGSCAAQAESREEPENPPEYPGDPALLAGIVEISMLEPVGNPGDLTILSDTELTYRFAIGLTCGPDRLAQQPGAVTADYSGEAVSIVIDPSTRNCSEEAQADENDALIRITLSEPIDGRTVTVDAGDSDE